MATKVYKPKRKISATESEEIKIPASSVDGLSTVATSGSYNDLSNKPTIPDVSGKANLSGGNIFDGGSQDFLLPPNGSFWVSDSSDNTIFDVSAEEGVAIGRDVEAPILLAENAGTSGQVLTSQGAGKTPQWTTPTKGTVTQVKINGTTKSPNSAGLVDLGTISGGSGVQILTPTNNTITLSILSAGLYLCKFDYNTTYTIVSQNKTFTIMYTGTSYATLIVKTSNTAELSWSDYKGRVFEQYSISDFGVYHTTAYKSYEYWSADSFDFKLFSDNANGELDILVETDAASDQNAVFGVMLGNGEDVFADIGGQIQFKDDVPCGLTVKKCGQSGTITYHYDGSNNNSLSLYKTMTLGVWLYIQISDQTESSLITRCILNGSVTEIV